MAIAKRLGKPLMIGELGLHAVPRTDTNVWNETPDYFESYDDTPAAKAWVVKTLNDVIEAGVPLTYWWCYQSDRPSDQKDPQRFDLDRDRNPELVACIVEANKRLKAKLQKGKFSILNKVIEAGVPLRHHGGSVRQDPGFAPMRSPKSASAFMVSLTNTPFLGG